MLRPKVTVLMPVYNGEAFVGQAVKSVLKQTFHNWELLIINDGSSDSSLAIIEAFADTRIRVVQNEKNLGLVKTRNLGLKESRGEYIAMLDCDDIALPERLASQVQFLDTNPDFGLVASQIIFIDEKSKEVGRERYAEKTENIPAILFFNNYLAQSSVMVRQNIIKNLSYREEYPPAEDYDLWVRLSRLTKIKILQKPLIKYRLHSENISVKKAREGAEAVQKILYNQLVSLLIKPSVAEFYLHTRIANFEFEKNRDFINQSASWLLKLNQANENTRLYPENVFKEILVKRFILICGKSGEGFWAVFRFFKFPLLNLSNLNITEIVKLFIKVIKKG